MKTSSLIFSLLIAMASANANAKIESIQEHFGRHLILTSGETSRTLQNLLAPHPDFTCDSGLNCRLYTSMKVQIHRNGGVTLTGETKDRSELFLKLLEVSPSRIDRANAHYGYYGYRNPKNRINFPVLQVGGFGGNDHCGDLCVGGSTYFRVDLSALL